MLHSSRHVYKSVFTKKDTFTDINLHRERHLSATESQYGHVNKSHVQNNWNSKIHDEKIMFHD